MSKQNLLLLSKTSSESRAALLEGGRLVELRHYREDHSGLKGSIYLAKVRRILPGMEAAFVDIGTDKSGFLHRDNTVSKKATQQYATATTITSILREGELILVQILKEARADKGPVLSMKLSLATSSLVLLPFERGISISKKIDDPKMRERLINIIGEQRPQQEFGIVVRTTATRLDDKAFERDLCYLESQWQDLNERAKELRKPMLLLAGDDPVQSFVKSMLVNKGSNIAKIITACEASGSMIREILSPERSVFDSRDIPELEQFQSSSSAKTLFETYSVEQEIKAALRSNVVLDEGVSLIIDQTEALTAIDVNSSAFLGKTDHQKTLLQANLAACEEIFRQLRLRNLSGIIIVDFINMKGAASNKELESKINSLLSEDDRVTSVSKMSANGVLEIIRGRESASLRELLCVPCEHCQGAGFVESPLSVCYELLRQINKQIKSVSKKLTVLSSEPVIELLGREFAGDIEAAQREFGVVISLQASSHYQMHDYDIVLS